MLAFVFWVAEEGYGCQFGEEELVPQLVLLVGLVDGEYIRAKDEEDGSPCLEKS